jgi:hypothetical protein
MQVLLTNTGIADCKLAGYLLLSPFRIKIGSFRIPTILKEVLLMNISFFTAVVFISEITGIARGYCAYAAPFPN